MLKRWLAVFMAAALCLTLLPVGVLAEDSTAEPQLFVQYLCPNSEGLLIVDPYHSLETSREMPTNGMFHAFFYYGTSENDFIQVPSSSLRAKNTCISVDEIPADELADPNLADYAVAVQTKEIGTSAVIYTDAEAVEHEFPVTVTFPSIAFFDTDVRSESSYTANELVYTGSSADGTSQYYLLCEDGWSITAVNTDPSEEGQDLSFFSWTPVTGSNGQSVVQVSISDGFEDGYWYQIQVFAKNSDGNEMSSWFSFSITDASPGLKYRYVDEADGVYFVEDELNGEIDKRMDQGMDIAVYYVNGDDEILLPLSSLNIPDIASAKLLDKTNDSYFRLSLNEAGSGAITCDAYPDLSIPVAVDLPRAAFYSSTERTSAAYLGETLSFTGLNTDSNGNAYETVYILPEDGWVFTGLTLDPDDEGYDMDFFGYEIAEDGSYVTVTLTDGFADYQYGVDVSMQRTNGNGSSTPSLWFEIQDNRPGLKFRFVNEKKGQYVEEEELNSAIEDRITNSDWIAVYYVNGSEETQIPISDLDFPSNVSARLLDESNDYYIRLSYDALGTGKITCDDYPGCSIPVTIDLPRAAFYSSTNRSGDTYLGEALSFTGLNTDSDGNAYETVYILPEDDWEITELTLDPDNNGYDMDFFSYVIAEDGSYVTVTLTEGFIDEEYDLEVSMRRTNGNGSSSPNLQFEIKDNRPGLRFKTVDNDKNDNYFEEDGFNSSLDRQIDTGDWVAVYYINGTTEIPIPLSDLTLPSNVSARLLDEGNDYYIQLNFIAFGYDEITCEDYPDCSIPVSVSLPILGFYTTETRSENTYAGETLAYTGASTDGSSQYYLLWEDGWTVTGINTDPDNEGQDLSFFEWKTVTDTNGNEVVLVSINDGFETGRWYDISVSAENSNGGTWTRWCGFSISDARPGLKYRHLDRQNDECYINPSNELESSLTGQPNRVRHVAFYYIENGQETLLEYDDLTFPSGFISTMYIQNDPTLIDVEFKYFGSGEITYTTEDGVTYALPVAVVLPDVGFYTEPIRSEETFIDGLMGAMPGEIAEAYLIWDPEEIDNFDDVLVTFEYGNSMTQILDEVSMSEAEDILAEYGIVLTLHEDECYIKVEAVVDARKSLNLILQQDRGGWGTWIDIDNALTVKIHEWRSNKENPVIFYDGEEYTFGIGRAEDGDKFDMFDAGQGFGATSSGDGSLHETVYLGAMVDYNTDAEKAAPAWLYDCISDVSFEIVDYINAHDLNDQAESNVYITDTYTSQINGCAMETVELETVPGGFVEALLRVTFTVTMPGEEPVMCSVDNVVHYAYNKQLYPDMSDIDTTLELNEILSSYDAFVAWVQKQDAENKTDLYQQYLANQSLNWEASFILKLPAVTYDGIIEVNLNGIDFQIKGTTNASGETTTMPGMWLHKNTFFFLSDIDFKAVPGITQEYAGETFTCGILANSEKIHDGLGDVYTVHGCTFTGFDYGVRNTPYGYVCVGGRNYFRDCNVAYLIDCAGKTGGNANDTTSDTIFENCKTAVMILGLPEYITPYDYRIYECDFISNDVDFDVQASGIFYFYRNFYGSVGTVMTDVTPTVPTIEEGTYTTVCTNPRYAFPLLVMGDTSSFNYLYLDTGFTTYIPNSEASTLAVDVEELEEGLAATDDAVTINVLGDDEEVQGTWTFNGTEE